MDVLVIGGTLYFGKVIVRKLLERGDNVTTYSRGNTQPEFWNDVSHILGDRTDYDGFVKNLKDKEFDAVIDNLAFTVEDTQATVRALRGNIGKYLVASTVSIYGGPGHALERETVDKRGGRDDFLNEFVDLDGCAPMREEDVDFEKVDWVYRDDIDEYGQGKRQIERYLDEIPNFPSVAIRVPATLGPEDPSLRFWWYMQRILDGREIVLRDGGSNIFRNGFRDDVAQAFIDAMDSPKAVNKIYNVAQREVTTLLRFLEVMAGHLRHELNVVPVPGDAAETINNLPWANRRFDPFSRPPVYVMSIEKARRDFDLHSTPMTDWVALTADWYLENHDGTDSAYYDIRDQEVAFARWWRDQYGRFIETAEAPK